MMSSLGAACASRLAPAVVTRRPSISSPVTNPCQGVTVVAHASTSERDATESNRTPGASLRAVLGADDKAWSHIVSSPEGREMVTTSPRALTLRLLALRDALCFVSNVHDLDVTAMVIEQPSLATFSGDIDIIVRRAWMVLETTLGPSVVFTSKARTCPCGFAHVLRRTIDVLEECAVDGDGNEIESDGDVSKLVRKRLGSNLLSWLKNEKEWFVVFSSCLGSEWGYLHTMETYATKTVEGTSLESFRKGSAYIAKNRHIRPLTSHVRAPVAMPKVDK